MKNRILITISCIALLSFIVAGAALDSDSWTPTIVCAVSAVWLDLMILANWERLEKW